MQPSCCCWVDDLGVDVVIVTVFFVKEDDADYAPDNDEDRGYDMS